MSQRQRTAFRELDGILLLDKPAGLTSNQALQRVRHLFGAAKAGHTGSLDPLATGLLPICFGEATKIAGLLLGARKAYETVARLGIVTDSDDADGAVQLTRAVPELDADRIEAALVPLRGRIRQRPPAYSALKQGGEPLYAKARRGEAVDVPEREVDVFALDQLECAGDRLRLRVECGSGTYVRSLVRALGEALGCGAHVEELRRLWVEPFAAPRMHTLPELQALAESDGGGQAGSLVNGAGTARASLDACLLPIEAGLASWPRVALEAEAARRWGQGQAVPVSTPAPPGACVAVFDASGRALGLGEVADNGRLRPQRLFRWASV